MNQQGERPTAAPDDWWNRLYDESARDSGAAAGAGDTLDDRFDSAVDAVGAPEGEDAPGTGEAPAAPGAAPATPEAASNGPDADQTGPDVTAAGREATPQAAPDAVETVQQAPPPAPGPAHVWWEQPPRSPAPPPPPAPVAPAPSPPSGPPQAGPSGGAPWFTPAVRPLKTDPVVRDPRTPAEPPEASAPPAPFVPPAPSAPPVSQPRESPQEAPARQTPALGAPAGADPWSSGERSGAQPDGRPGDQPARRPDEIPSARIPEPPQTPQTPEAPGARSDETAGTRRPGTSTPGTRTPAPLGTRPPWVPPSRGKAAHVGDGPPAYAPEPTALPPAQADALDDVVPDTVLDGARYGTYTLRAVSVRGDSGRHRGEPRRDALLTARFGAGDVALVLVVVASGGRTAGGAAHQAAADACRWIAGAVGRNHSRLSEDIRGGRRGDLTSGLQRLADRACGKLRARAAELGLPPEEYTAGLRCLLLTADPACRSRVVFGVGPGGLFRLRDGAWEDLEQSGPGLPAAPRRPAPDEGAAPGDRLTTDLGLPAPPSPYVEALVPPPEPFRFQLSVARPGDTLLLCGAGLAEPLRGAPGLSEELAARWSSAGPPGLAGFLTDVQLRVKGYADDRTAVAVWEA